MTRRTLSPRVLGCLVEAIHRVEKLWGNAPTTEAPTSLYPIAEDPSGRGPRMVARRLYEKLPKAKKFIGRIWGS